MNNIDNYIDYINKMDEEDIKSWSQGLNDLINEDIHIEEGYDYSELERAYLNN